MANQSTDLTYIAVLLEQIDGKFDVLAEEITDIRRTMATKQDMHQVKTDIRTIKAVVTDQSKQLFDHEARLPQPKPHGC